MHIREAGRADRDLVARMRLRFLAEHRSVDELSAAFVAATDAFVAESMQAATLLSWLADDDGGTCIGVVSMVLQRVPPHPDQPQTWEGYVVNMYVEPEHRQQGVGRALLVALQAKAVELELRRLYLHATDAGRPMYEQAGFTPDARWMHLPL